MLFLLALLGRIRRHHVAALLALAAVSILTGAILFSITQHVGFGDALYWAVTTATTVGYGDVLPHDATGKAIAVGVMLTAIPLFGAVFALVAGMAALVQVRRLFAMEHALPTERFAVIYGMHPAVPRILDELAKADTPVVLVADVDPATIPPGVQFIAGDPTVEAVIRKSHPERAGQALVTGDSDGDVLVTCVALRSIAPDLEISALSQSPKVAQALQELGVPRTVSGDELIGHTLAKCLESPHTAELLLRLVDSDAYRVKEVPVGADHIGETLGHIRDHSGGLILGLVKGTRVTLGVEEDPVVEDGDHLLVVTVTHTAQR